MNAKFTRYDEEHCAFGSHQRKLMYILIVLAFILSAASNSGASQHRIEVIGPRGRATQVERNVQREPGHKTVEKQWQNEHGGGQAERETVRDRENHTVTAKWSRSNSQGETVSGAATGVKTGAGFQLSATTADVQGIKREISKTGIRNPEGGLTIVDTQVVAPRKTFTTAKTVTKTESGRSANGVYCPDSGPSGQWSCEVSHAPGESVRSTTLTNHAGNTISKSSVLTYNANSASRTVTIVKVDGEAETSTISVENSTTMEPIP